MIRCLLSWETPSNTSYFISSRKKDKMQMQGETSVPHTAALGIWQESRGQSGMEKNKLAI